MKKKGVIISALGKNTFSKEQVEQIESVIDVNFFAQLDKIKDEDFIDLCENSEIVGITRRPLNNLDESIIKKLPNLKGVAIYSTGYEWVDIDYLHKRGIALSHLPDYATITVAEHILGMILTLSRRIHLSFDKVRGYIPPEISLRGSDLYQKRLGIIGYGRIGQRLKKISEPFGMDVYYFDNKNDTMTENFLPLNDLLKTSDIIALTANKERNAIPTIDTKEISKMKSGAFIVNAARASLVDNYAILDAIKTHKISGYGVDDKIDLFLNDKEIEKGRILQTGHTAWYSTEAIIRGTQEWVENIVALSTDKPINIVR